MYSPYNCNNCSLFWIPEWVWNPNYLGDKDLFVWSCHTWKRDKSSSPSLQVLIKYKFRLDRAGLYRAEAKSIWTRSDRLEVYKGVKIVLGNELEDYKGEIRERQERLFGYSNITDWYIARYRFNYIAANPYADLSDLDCDHKIQDNPNVRRLADYYGATVPDAWLKASDDRFLNLGPKTRAQHQTRHANEGGVYAFPFNRSEYHSS